MRVEHGNRSEPWPTLLWTPEEVILVWIWPLGHSVSALVVRPHTLSEDSFTLQIALALSLLSPFPFLLDRAIRRRVFGDTWQSFCDVRILAVFASWILSLPFSANLPYSATMVAMTAMGFFIAVMYITTISQESMRVGLSYFSTALTSLLLIDAFLLQGIPLGIGAGYHYDLKRSTEYLACAALAFCWRNRPMRYVTFVGAVLLLLVSGRRAAILAVLTLVVFHGAAGLYKSRRDRPLALLLVFLTGLLCLLFLPIVKEIIYETFAIDDAYRGLGTGFTGRTERWQAGWELFIKYPVFGVGFRGHQLVGEVPDVHNGYLAHLIETGIVGFSVAMGLVMLAMQHAAQSIQRHLNRALTGLAMAYLTWAFFERFLFNVGNLLSCLFILWLVCNLRAHTVGLHPRL